MSCLGLSSEKINYKNAYENFNQSCSLRRTLKLRGEHENCSRWAASDVNSWEDEALWCSGHRYSEAAKEEKVREKVMPTDDYLIGHCSPLGKDTDLIGHCSCFTVILFLTESLLSHPKTSVCLW
jgi:hypothetical protein